MAVYDSAIAVIGAGHGGLTLAAHLGVHGHRVHLFNRTASTLLPVRRNGGIELHHEDGSVTFGPIAMVSTRMAKVLRGTRLVLVVVPASAHRDIARQCAQHLDNDHVVILNPGRTGGALEFRRTLSEMESRAHCIVGETATFLFASRCIGAASVRIYGVKKVVPVAALPALDTPKLMAALPPALESFIPAPSVLYTSMENLGAIFHPVLTLLNVGRIESGQGGFQFYVEGLTPGIVRVLAAADAERVAIGRALGVATSSACEWLSDSYSRDVPTLREAIVANPSYQGIPAPSSMDHRYLHEEVPMSLVPLSQLATLAGVATPIIDSLIDLACVIHSVDYRSAGRTLTSLNLSEMSIPELHHFVATGERLPHVRAHGIRWGLEEAV